MKTAFLGAVCAGFLAISASSAMASPITFHVDVNSALLIGSPAGPFWLDFQLNNGTTLLNNTATVNNFNFGIGGAAVGAPVLIGGATGDLSSNVVNLTDSSAFNEFYQVFTPGSFLSFDVTLSRNVEGPTPDAFSFSILDGNQFNIPTTGVGDSLLLLSINSTTLTKNDAQTGVSTGPVAGITATVVPEPASLVLVALGVVGMVARRRQLSHSRAA